MLSQIIACVKCGGPLTVPLIELETTRNPMRMGDRQPALPTGIFWKVIGDAEFMGVREGNLVVNPSDVRHTVPAGDRSGCCGPSGISGPNLSCACGHKVGTEATDCWTPQMVHFEAEAISLKGAVEAAVQFLVFEGGSSPDAWQFFAWIHQALSIDGWLGNDVRAIGTWAGEQKHRVPVRILWRHSALATKANVSIDDLATVLEDASRGALVLFRD